MDTLVVMNGYLGSEVEFREGEYKEGGRYVFAWFSLGCTPRFRTANGEWRDGETTWITVHCSRTLADNVRFSLRKGDPVIVVGRLTTRTFEYSDGSGKGSTLRVEASGVGHDLGLGCSTYRRVKSVSKESRQTEGTVESAVSVATGVLPEEADGIIPDYSDEPGNVDIEDAPPSYETVRESPAGAMELDDEQHEQLAA
jgi:single-strand DNA-binding protein